MTPQPYVLVSPEMTLWLGPGAASAAPMPPAPAALSFGVAAQDGPPCFHLDPSPDLNSPASGALTLYIERAAFERVGGVLLEQTEAFHLPTALRVIVVSILECGLQGETRQVYRLGKSIELLCEMIRLQASGELVPVAVESDLSLEDSRRIAAARRVIDERWSEKLTLDGIARACGLNRAKLTRGFREMFHCTIAEAIAERRLRQASLMLRTTDLPVSSIGYENGYLNNASFARAFSRRFGVSPSDFRACQMHAA